jgi:LysM repeat protein
MAIASLPVIVKADNLTTTRKWLMTLTAGPGHKTNSEFTSSRETAVNPETSTALSSPNMLSPAPALSGVLENPSRLAPEILVGLEAAPLTPLQTPARIHIVMKGESLWNIARHYGVALKELMTINCLNDKAVLHIGQSLTLPVTAVPGNTADKSEPLFLDGKILLPLRKAVETCGGQIYWDPVAKHITILHGGKTLLINPAGAKASVNGQPLPCRNIFLRSGRTYVSREFLSQTALLPTQDKPASRAKIVARLAR